MYTLLNRNVEMGHTVNMIHWFVAHTFLPVLKQSRISSNWYEAQSVSENLVWDDGRVVVHKHLLNSHGWHLQHNIHQEHTVKTLQPSTAMVGTCNTTYTRNTQSRHYNHQQPWLAPATQHTPGTHSQDITTINSHGWNLQHKIHQEHTVKTLQPSIAMVGTCNTTYTRNTQSRHYNHQQPWLAPATQNTPGTHSQDITTINSHGWHLQHNIHQEHTVKTLQPSIAMVGTCNTTYTRNTQSRHYNHQQPWLEPATQNTPGTHSQDITTINSHGWHLQHNIHQEHTVKTLQPSIAMVGTCNTTYTRNTQSRHYNHQQPWLEPATQNTPGTHSQDITTINSHGWHLQHNIHQEHTVKTLQPSIAMVGTCNTKYTRNTQSRHYNHQQPWLAPATQHTPGTHSQDITTINSHGWNLQHKIHQEHTVKTLQPSIAMVGTCNTTYTRNTQSRHYNHQQPWLEPATQNTPGTHSQDITTINSHGWHLQHNIHQEHTVKTLQPSIAMVGTCNTKYTRNTQSRHYNHQQPWLEPATQNTPGTHSQDITTINSHGWNLQHKIHQEHTVKTLQPSIAMVGTCNTTYTWY